MGLFLTGKHITLYIKMSLLEFDVNNFYVSKVLFRLMRVNA